MDFGRKILGIAATSVLLVVGSACGDEDPLDNESFSGLSTPTDGTATTTITATGGPTASETPDDDGDDGEGGDDDSGEGGDDSNDEG